MATQDVIVTRPSELHIAPTFQANVHEVPVNLYRLKVSAQSFDSRRFSFSWRSPGSRLLCSPQAYLSFELICHVPYIMTESECMSAIHGLVDRGPYRADQIDQQSEQKTESATIGGKVGAYATRTYGSANRREYLDYVGPDASALGIAVNAGSATGIPGGGGYRAGCAFGEGNACLNSVESIQYTINGCSISHQNWHLFKRSLDRCYIPSRVMQRCFYSCGGAWNAYDVKPVSGALSNAVGWDQDPTDNLAEHKRGAANCVEAFTADSGLARRMKNFFSSMCEIESTDVKAGKNFKEQFPGTWDADNKSHYLNGTSFVIRIKVPLSGGLFNPVWGETGLSRSCPYNRLPLAIPNYNQGSLTVLFRDLEKSIVRRLGRTLSRDRNIYGTLINNSESTNVSDASELLVRGPTAIAANAGELFRPAPFTIVLREATIPTIHLQYLRLQSFRAYPEVSQFATYRTQTYLGPMMTGGNFKKSEVEAAKFVTGRGTLLGAFDQPLEFLPCSGGDLHSRATGVHRGAAGNSNLMWEVAFDNLQFAQPPTYLFICAQKSSECYSHQTPLVGLKEADLSAAVPDLTEARARANILDLPTVTQDKQVAATKLAGRYLAQNQDSNLAIVKFSLMVQSSVGTFEVSGDKYPFLQDQQNIWDQHKRNCNAEYFADGGFNDWQKRGCCILLSVSQYLHGLGSSAGVSFPVQISINVFFENKCAFISGLYANDPSVKGTIVWKDYIRARPVVCGLFDKQVLQIASSSAVLSALNMSQNNLTATLSSRP